MTKFPGEVKNKPLRTLGKSGRRLSVRTEALLILLPLALARNTQCPHPSQPSPVYWTEKEGV